MRLMPSQVPRTGPPTSGLRTDGPWRPWHEAWADAAYGSDGFWSTQQPRDHFTTGVRASPLVARAVAGLVPAEAQVVVDVGAGDGALLAALAETRPDVRLVSVDRRPRPTGLDDRVGWVEDHWDVDTRRWTGEGPGGWCAGRVPVLVAHEWLDDLPVPLVAHEAGAWHEVEVDPAGHERAGRPVGPMDAGWLDWWWTGGRRAEVGRVRDVAWATLVGAAVGLGGRALAVDYGHLADQRPPEGGFTAYGRGRQRAPVPDGSVNLTAAVAVDALAAAGEEVGAATLLLARQSAVLPGVPAPGPRGGLAEEDGDALTALVRRSEHAALTAPGRWGDLWWLLQGAPTSASPH